MTKEWGKDTWVQDKSVVTGEPHSPYFITTQAMFEDMLKHEADGAIIADGYMLTVQKHKGSLTVRIALAPKLGKNDAGV